VSQKVSSTFSLDSPTTSTLGSRPILGAPPWPRAAPPRSTTPGGWRSRQPFALLGVAQRTATLGDRHAGPPLRAPVGPVVDGRRGTDLPFLHLHRFHRRDAVVVLGEPVRLVAVEVDPFDTVAVAVARRDHVPPSPSPPPRLRRWSFSLTAPRWPRPTNRAGPPGSRLTEICTSELPSVTAVRYLTRKLFREY
jgi:hypothetical protein